MANDNVVAVRLTPAQMELLESLCATTGWTYSQVLRHLLESATVRPAIIKTELPQKEPA